MTPQTDRERVATLLFYAAVLLLAYLVFQVFQPFLVPLGWAAVLVAFFYPWHARLERRWGATRAAALSTVALAVIVIAPMLFVMGAFVREGVQAVGDIQRAVAERRLEWIERAWSWIDQRAPGVATIDLGAMASEGAQRIGAFLAAQAAAVVQNVALFIFDLVVALFAAFFLFRDAGAIMNRIRRALPFDEPLRERMIAQARDLVAATVAAAAVVAGVQGLLGGLAFAILGIDAPVFWGVLMAFFCLLPLGAWVIWLPAAVLLIVSGHLWRGLVLVGLGVGIVSSVDNFLRPALLSGRARLNGLLVFISLLGGMSVFGLLGLVLGPILLATAAGLLEAYTSDAPAKRR